MSESYLENCINALPPGKQPAAREAFKAIAENGDDNLISKLLVILEATSAYAAHIPQTLSANGERFLGELDSRLTKVAKFHDEQEATREARLHQLLVDQLPQLGRALAIDEVAAGLKAQAAELGRFERSLVRLRQARVGGLLLLMLLGFWLGAGAVVGFGWRNYNDAQQAAEFVARLHALGVVMKVQKTEGGELLTIDGPGALQGTGWRKDAKGYLSGADLMYPTPERQ